MYPGKNFLLSRPYSLEDAEQAFQRAVRPDTTHCDAMDDLVTRQDFNHVAGLSDLAYSLDVRDSASPILAVPF